MSEQNSHDLASPTNGIFTEMMKISKVSHEFHSSFKIQQPFSLTFHWHESTDNFKPYKVLAHPEPQTIECGVDIPQELELINTPLKVELLGDIAPAKPGCAATPLHLEKAVLAKYKVTNLCEDQVFECVAILDDENKFFFCAGEIRTRLDIMPCESVILEYQLLPLYMGYHDLPKLHLLNRAGNPEAAKVNVKKLNDPVYLQSLVDKKHGIEYLIKGFTTKVLIQH